MFQYQKPNFNFLAALQSLSSGLPIVLHTVLTVSQVFPSSSSTSGIILASSLQRCSDNRLVGCSFIFLSGAVMITSLLLRSAADRHCLYLISFGFHAFEHVRTSLFSDKIIFTFITTMTDKTSRKHHHQHWDVNAFYCWLLDLLLSLHSTLSTHGGFMHSLDIWVSLTRSNLKVSS